MVLGIFPSRQTQESIRHSYMPIEKVIVLEDDKIVRNNLEQVLRRKRYDVAAASTIAKLRRKKKTD